MRPALTPCWERYVRTAWARLAPSAMLYSRVPRSSAWPSMVKVYCGYARSHCACFSRVETDCCVSSVESVSKKTRSPTLTTKSCWLPGTAALALASEGLLGSRGFLAQPAIAIAVAMKPTNFAARAKRLIFLIPEPPFSLLDVPHGLAGAWLSKASVNLDGGLHRTLECEVFPKTDPGG